MDDLDRPTLGLRVDAEIEAALYEVETSYWEQLREMQWFIHADSVFLGLNNPPQPPPKLPKRVLSIIASYARALFDTAQKYPRDPKLPRKLRQLAKSTSRRVMAVLVRLETAPYNRLEYHGVTLSEMRKTVDEALRQAVQDHLQGLASDAHPQPQEPTTTMNVQSTSQLVSTVGVKAGPAKQLVHATNEEELTAMDAEAKASPSIIQNSKTTGRRDAIDAFISKVAETGRKITRKDIWTVAGYKDSTEFQRYQRHDARTTASATSNFKRVLSMHPGDFIALLEKQTARK
jgi:hypothetical protein